MSYLHTCTRMMLEGDKLVIDRLEREDTMTKWTDAKVIESLVLDTSEIADVLTRDDLPDMPLKAFGLWKLLSERTATCEGNDRLSSMRAVFDTLKEGKWSGE